MHAPKQRPWIFIWKGLSNLGRISSFQYNDITINCCYWNTSHRIVCSHKLTDGYRLWQWYTNTIWSQADVFVCISSLFAGNLVFVLLCNGSKDFRTFQWCKIWANLGLLCKSGYFEQIWLMIPYKAHVVKLSTWPRKVNDLWLEIILMISAHILLETLFLVLHYIRGG